MPRGNGTGPIGEGPMTGRGMGNCVTNSAPGYMNLGQGRFGVGRGGQPWGCGSGRAWGRGRSGYRGSGWGRGPRPAYESAPANTEEEKKHINEEINSLQAELDNLKKYLTELDEEKK